MLSQYPLFTVAPPRLFEAMEDSQRANQEYLKVPNLIVPHGLTSWVQMHYVIAVAIAVATYTKKHIYIYIYIYVCI